MSSGCAISGNSSSDGEVELTIFDDPADGKANSNIIYSIYLLHYYIWYLELIVIVVNFQKLIALFFLVISIGWSRSSYVVTEGEDAKILICADIVHGALQTTVTVPFINVTGIGMHNVSQLLEYLFIL